MISVIVPIYNVDDYLDECLSSIINQTYEDIEVLCINDCTLDNSINIVKKYMRLDKRVHLINHRQNRGLGGARNTGIENARGEYIAFVDSDDILDLTMLEKMERAITQENVEAVICGIRRFIDNQEIARLSTFHCLPNPKTGVYGIEQHKERLVNIWPSAPNKLYKTSIIREHNLKYQEKLLYEDHFFYYSYFTYVKRFYFINEPLYSYRAARAGSITSTLTGRENEVYTVLESLKDIFVSSFGAEKWLPAYERICFRLIWERQFNMWTDVRQWLVYTKKAEQWLLNRFSLQDLKNVVDESIDRMDPFYRYIFATGAKKQLYHIKLHLKKSKLAVKIHNILQRLKGYRTTRNYVKELSLVAWNTNDTLNKLVRPVWKVHDTVIEPEKYENSIV